MFIKSTQKIFITQNQITLQFTIMTELRRSNVTNKIALHGDIKHIATIGGSFCSVEICIVLKKWCIESDDWEIISLHIASQIPQESVQ